MFKILILAYLIGQDPVDTQKTFVLGNNFEYDWLMAGCKNEDTGEEFIIEPSYPKGKPDELEGIILDKNFNKKPNI